MADTSVLADTVLVIDENGVRTIRFNRPDKKNALTRAMYSAAAEGLEGANEDKAVRAVILTGAPGIFTAGNDLGDFMAHPPHIGKGEMPPVERFMHALYKCKKPVIAAVDGVAVGIGTTLLLHCDLVYASSQAKFKTPFVDLALAPEFGSSMMFEKAFGRAAASDLLLLGSVWGAERALQTGLVTAVVKPEELEGVARFAGETLAAKAPGSLMAAKALMREPEEALEDRMKREGDAFATMLRSEEFKEAATAFMERRAPDFAKFG
jgi:enoyl-CoA hydratase/carnithine racemase